MGINSNSEFVGWARSGQVINGGIDSDSLRGTISYIRDLPSFQQVSISSPSAGGRVVTAIVQDAVEIIGGELVITNTFVVLLGFSFTLAFFLALSIDWGSKEPIIWSITFGTDLYTDPYTLPIFIDSLQYSYLCPPSSLSAVLRSF